ncbi:MAG: hypothetical protein KAI43_02740 [Candidatus Aureabacteria bacterium]|nr:hypothetical protein [Candidatus Auribacterota bacterium]
MENKHLKLALLAAFLLLGYSIMSLINQNKQKLREQVESAFTGEEKVSKNVGKLKKEKKKHITRAERIKSEKLIKICDLANKQFEKAESLLESRDFLASYNTYSEALMIVESLDKNSYYLKIDDNTSIYDFLKERRLSYLKKIDSFKEAFVEALSDLRISKKIFDEITKIDYAKSKELRGLFKKKRKEIIKKRKRILGDYLLINIIDKTNVYSGQIELALFKKIPEDYLKKTAVGDVMSRNENKLVWKKLTVTIYEKTLDFNQLTTIKNGKRSGWRVSNYELPTGVELDFKMESSDGTPTSWDRIETVRIKIDAPKEVMLDSDNPWVFSEKKEEQRLKIKKELYDALQKMKELTTYPDYTPEAPLFDEGKLNIKTLDALRYNDIERFEKEVSSLNSSNDADVQYELCSYIIKYKIKEHSKTAKECMFRIPDDKKKRILIDLRKNPSFGDYKVTIALAASSRKKGILYPSLVHVPFDDVEVRKEVLEYINLPSVATEEARGYLVSRFFNSFQRGEKPDLNKYSDLIMDSNKLVRNNYLRACKKLDPAYGNKLFVDYFHKIPREGLRRFLLDLKLVKSEYLGDVAAILEEIAMDPEEDKKIKRIALAKLKTEGKTKEIWDVLRRIHTSPEYQKDSSLERALVYSISDAYPEKAYVFLKDYIDRGKYLSDAIDGILKIENKKKDAIILLNDVYKNNNSDLNLEKTLLKKLSSNLYSGTWDFKQPELIMIMEKALQSEQEKVKGYAYNLMYLIAKNGSEKYLEELKRYSNNEQNERLRRKINNYLKKLQ